MVVIAGLGFSSGLPILLVYSTLTLWMTELDISFKTIGFASTVLAPYKFKWLWAPSTASNWDLWPGEAGSS